MDYMFSVPHLLMDIGNWDVSNVLSMYGMFSDG